MPREFAGTPCAFGSLKSARLSKRRQMNDALRAYQRGTRHATPPKPDIVPLAQRREGFGSGALNGPEEGRSSSIEGTLALPSSFSIASHCVAVQQLVQEALERACCVEQFCPHWYTVIANTAPTCEGRAWNEPWKSDEGGLLLRIQIAHRLSVRDGAEALELFRNLTPERHLV